VIEKDQQNGYLPLIHIRFKQLTTNQPNLKQHQRQYNSNHRYNSDQQHLEFVLAEQTRQF
jgi:hypothetical protein